MTSRRTFLAAAVTAPVAGGPRRLLVDTHIHLFAADQKRFPYHPQGPYKPEAAELPDYLTFVAAAGIRHTVIVHPEPYQDDHRYLEHCFAHERPKKLFKGTCLFDPTDPRTPARMAELVKRHPDRIVAMRIHAMNKPGEPALKQGPIKNRDLADPMVETVWRKARELGLAVQMHFLPHHAPAIEALVRRVPEVPVILDHLARAGMGTPADYQKVLALARHPSVYMKYSGVPHSSKQKYPYADVKPIVRQAYDAFGADRMIWGGLGHNRDEFGQADALLDLMFDYAPAGDRDKIRGLTAQRLFRFS